MVSVSICIGFVVCVCLLGSLHVYFSFRENNDNEAILLHTDIVRVSLAIKTIVHSLIDGALNAPTSHPHAYDVDVSCIA